MNVASDRDMLHVVRNLGLNNEQLNIFYVELGLTEAHIEAAKLKTADAGTHSIFLQGLDVLRLWRRVNGNKATRMALVKVLDACGYHEQLRMLQQEWDIILKGTVPQR